MPRISQVHKILEAALACFAETGYEATRIHQIAKKAGVAESALYRHYASKEDIAHTLFQRHFQNLKSGIEEIANLPLSAEARLKEIVKLALNQFRATPEAICYVLLQPPQFEQKLPEEAASLLKMVAQLIEEGQQHGSIRPGPPALLAAAFVGCFVQLFAFAQLPFFQEVARDLILQNESLVVEMAWAVLASARCSVVEEG